MELSHLFLKGHCHPQPSFLIDVMEGVGRDMKFNFNSLKYLNALKYLNCRNVSNFGRDWSLSNFVELWGKLSK